MKKQIEVGNMILLPPKKGTCPECATEHTLDMPHNASSLYYQVKFMMEHKREPNWADAMSHCTDEVKAMWRKSLSEMGIPESQFVEVIS